VLGIIKSQPNTSIAQSADRKGKKKTVHDMKGQNIVERKGENDFVYSSYRCPHHQTVSLGRGRASPAWQNRTTQVSTGGTPALGTLRFLTNVDFSYIKSKDYISQTSRVLGGELQREKD